MLVTMYDLPHHLEMISIVSLKPMFRLISVCGFHETCQTLYSHLWIGLCSKQVSRQSSLATSTPCHVRFLPTRLYVSRIFHHLEPSYYIFMSSLPAVHHFL